jgi:hypothetical protein
MAANAAFTPSDLKNIPKAHEWSMRDAVIAEQWCH